MRKYGWTAVLLIAALMITGCTVFEADLSERQSGFEDGKLQVFFVDVGQGDCSLIRIGDRTLLIDGGESDSWEEDINPFMLENGFNSFSDILVSHYHTDHAGGIANVLGECGAERIFMPDARDNGGLKEKLSDIAYLMGTEVELVKRGDIIDIGNDDVNIEVLFPDSGLFANEERSVNNDSVVMRLDYFDTSFLFTGDLESDAEKVLLNSAQLDADVLKVGHHGSKTSTSAKFLKAVDPDYAVIQVGENNSYGHPHEKVVERIRKNDTMIYRTDKDGDIVFTVNEQGIEKIETER